MRIHPLLIATFLLCGVILVFLQFAGPNQTILVQEEPEQEGSVAQNDISNSPPTRLTHQSFATPYNENAVPFTDLSSSESKTKRDFWKSHKSSYKCPADLFRRIGKEKGDGGKWMCGLEKFAKLTVKDNYPCVFYSFGVSGDSSYESEVIQTTTCEVFAYDMSVGKIGKPLRPTNPRVHFHKLGLANGNNATMRTLKSAMDENGHSFIDILKIDVEGAEYDSFEQTFKEFPDGLPFGQLMIELHNNVKDWSPKGRRRILNLVEQLEKRGARVFSIEPNALAIDHCSEFAFINLNYRRLFIPDEDLDPSYKLFGDKKSLIK